MKNPNKKLGKKRTAYAVLGFLANSPKSGYDIKRAIANSTGYFWNESFGQIYPILKKLEAEGFVEKGDVESVGKRKSQKYSITVTGLEELKKWIAEPIESYVVRNELLLKMFFGRHVPREVLIAHLRNHRYQMERQLEVYQDYKASYGEPEARGHSNVEYFLAPLNHGIHTYGAIIEWCDETIEMLGDEKLTGLDETS